MTFAELPGTLAVPGICTQCGCDDDHACPGGCIWANSAMTLCSRCAQGGLGGKVEHMGGWDDGDGDGDALEDA